MKLNPFKLANSIALAFLVIHLSFDALSFFAPNILEYIFTSWFHGFKVRLNILDTYQGFSLTKMLFGLVTSVAVAWIIGYLIGYFYNKINSHGKTN